MLNNYMKQTINNPPGKGESNPGNSPLARPLAAESIPDNYSIIDLDFLGDDHSWPVYKWMLASRRTYQDELNPKIFYLDEMRRSYIYIDNPDIEIRE